MTTQKTGNGIQDQVREHYAAVARGAGTCCGPSTAGCCGTSPEASRALGYSPGELSAVPEGANLGLGCGNPQAIAALAAGETVLDLGSGAGFDCLLAARQVGPTGRVIGVDMTSEMVTRARANARQVAAANLEFRLGEIERLPVADATIDVVLSNCVINLSPDKPAVFREAFRVLKPGGRLALADIVATAALPVGRRDQLAAYTGCVAGAATVDELTAMLGAAGFDAVRLVVSEESRSFIRDWMPGTGAEAYVASATLEATKPARAARSCCGPDCCSPAQGSTAS